MDRSRSLITVGRCTTYVGDKAAGDITGENVQGVWFVVTPAGVQK